ncbi:MAG: ATP-binding cassette domain-containing protein [Coriobacteriales bacterium]|nr:ATP-binding cassette domain-containing protein [Coriobacteriales bacterium]
MNSLNASKVYNWVIMLIIENVCFDYEIYCRERASAAPGRLHALDLKGQAFSFERGERIALLGGNGSGKSTFLKLVSGIFAPSCGSITVDGVPVHRQFELRSQSFAGLVVQDPSRSTICSMVDEEISFGSRNLGLEAEVIRERMNKALEECALEHKKNDEIASLSGGELQRLCLASILVMKPAYLLLDEPFSMLDKESKDSLEKILNNYVQQGGTIIHATHRLNEVLDYDACLVFEAGSVIWNGPMAEFLQDKSLQMRSCSIGPEDQDSGYQQKIHTAKPLKEQEVKKAPVLQVKDVTFAFRSGSKDAETPKSFSDLACEPGSCTLVLGKTGAGKTTFLRLLAGLLKPLGGSILLQNKAVTAGDIGMVFQFPEKQFFASTVLDEVSFALLNKGMNKSEAYERSKEVLSILGLPQGIEQMSPFALSGGMQRLVALASILVMNTPVVLFDEPTVGLDKRNLELLLGILQRLKQEGKALIIATHDTDAFKGIAEKICQISNNPDKRSVLLSDPDKRTDLLSGFSPET